MRDDNLRAVLDHQADHHLGKLFEVARRRQAAAGATNAQDIVAALTEKESGRYSLAAGIRSLLGGPHQPKGLEWEVSAALAQATGRQMLHGNAFLTHSDLIFGRRDLTAASAAGGGYLVATSLGGEEIPAQRALPIIQRLGATRLTGLDGNLALLKVKTGATATWLSTEATPATESTQILGLVVFTPKTVMSFVEVSRQLLVQSVADQILARDLNLAANAAIDAAGISGSGASGEPLGLVNTTGINAITGTSLAWGGALDFGVNAGNANGELTGFATTPAIYKLLANRERFTGGGVGIINDGTLDGKPVLQSTGVPAGTLIGGDWSDVLIGEWGTIEIQFDKFTKFQTAIVAVRALFTVDVGVRYPNAFSVATAIT